MLNESLGKRTLNTLARLPQDKVREVADFADFVLKKYDEEVLQKGIEKLVSQSKTYDFLKDEENLHLFGLRLGEWEDFEKGIDYSAFLVKRKN